MINTILGNIAGIVQKYFLFAFFLPTLLFATAVAGAFGAAIGLESTMAAVESSLATRWAWTSSLGAVALVAAAYILSALRESMTQLWAGDAPLIRALLWGWVAMGQARQRRHYMHLRRRSSERSSWEKVLEEFEDHVGATWRSPGITAGPWTRWKLRIRIRLLHPWMSQFSVRARLTVIEQYWVRFDGESLTAEYELLKRRLLDWQQQSSYATQACAAELDRSFGALATVKATRLGNVIDSYNHYAFTRYRIEAELLWPRLQHVIPSSYSDAVQDAKVLLDFGVTMCTLATLYAVLAILIGPWLTYEPTLWSAIGVAALAVARFFYTLSVKSAMQYGDRLRSSFDLFRLELLEQFGVPRPTSLAEERATWEKLSQLVVYGAEVDLAIAGKKSA